MKNEDTTYAMIIPLLRDHIERIFDGKIIFCKYTGQKTFGIGIGTKILFYASGTGKRILGEAQVASLEQMKPDDLVAKHRERVFISPEELERYRGVRSRDLKLLVLRLSDVEKYQPPKIFTGHMTMTGMQLSRTQYQELMHNSNPTKGRNE